MNKKTKLLMTKKEFALVESGSPKNVKFHSAAQLKTYIKLSRKMRSKYRDLTRLQKVAQKPSQNYRTIAKAKVFDDILNRFENQLDRDGDQPPVRNKEKVRARGERALKKIITGDKQ